MKSIKSLLTLILSLSLLVFGVWFSLRNQQQLPLDLIFIQLPNGSLALWLILSLILGCLTGMLLMLPWLLRGKTRELRLNKELKQHKEELHQLRTFNLRSGE